MEWNSLDVILGILFAFFSLRGLFRGFVEEFFSVGAVVLGLVGASLFGPTFAKTAEELLPIQGWGG
ncbi:MAG TPA: CvpA family protein, partial [Spirochaetales bacterium]|nr:CvpA family protein [Spirochaetales bacterium]